MDIVHPLRLGAKARHQATRSSKGIGMQGARQQRNSKSVPASAAASCPPSSLSSVVIRAGVSGLTCAPRILALPVGATASRHSRCVAAHVHASATSRSAGPHITVVGAGVNGLTCAARILGMQAGAHDRGGIPGAQVTVFADRFSSDTTTAGAAGLWGPYKLGSTPEEQVCSVMQEERQRRRYDLHAISLCSGTHGVGGGTLVDTAECAAPHAHGRNHSISLCPICQVSCGNRFIISCACIGMGPAWHPCQHA